MDRLFPLSASARNQRRLAQKRVGLATAGHAIAGHERTKVALRAQLRSKGANASKRYELALVLERLGEIAGAAEELTKVLRLDPQRTDAARRLGDLLGRGVLPDDARLDAAGMLAALNHDVIDRDLICAASVHHLSRAGVLRRVLDLLAMRSVDDVARDLCLRRTSDVLKNDLLLAVLRHGIVVNPVVEHLLTALRRTILLEVPRARLDDPALVTFIEALLRLSWINEYVWAEGTEETAALEAQVCGLDGILSGDRECGKEFLIRVLYRDPLAILPADMIPAHLHNVYPDALRTALVLKLIERGEILWRADSVPQLGEIDNEISLKVAAQYEKSPYPRWTSVPLYGEGEYREYLGGFFPPHKLKFLQQSFEVLVAGCGTGRQAVSAAFDYGRSAQVLGLDIASNSLGYASRMAARMGAGNVSFARGDIAQIGTFQPSFAGRFHVIECSGVLHHMTDPFAGWRGLLDCLAADGIMLVGLYSAAARRGLEALKKEPMHPGAGCDDSALRTFRSRLMASPADALGSAFRHSRDFYSASGFRDLFLHVNERYTTLEEIGAFLAANRLVFCGFVNAPFAALERRFPRERWPGTLAAWSALEQTQPQIFAGMYQFWCTRG